MQNIKSLFPLTRSTVVGNDNRLRNSPPTAVQTVLGLLDCAYDEQMSPGASKVTTNHRAETTAASQLHVPPTGGGSGHLQALPSEQ